MKRRIVLGLTAVLAFIASLGLLQVAQRLDQGVMRTLLVITSLSMLGSSGLVVGWLTAEWFGIEQRRRVRGLVLAASLLLAMIMVLFGIPAVTEVSRGDLVRPIDYLLIPLLFALGLASIVMALLRTKGIVAPNRWVPHSPLSALLYGVSCVVLTPRFFLESLSIAEWFGLIGLFIMFAGHFVENRAKQRAGA